LLGKDDGFLVGLIEGGNVGIHDGEKLGDLVGNDVEGKTVGADGTTVGCSLGTLEVGSDVRNLVGLLVGLNTVDISVCSQRLDSTVNNLSLIEKITKNFG
jgi:hypothetical protein